MGRRKMITFFLLFIFGISLWCLVYQIYFVTEENNYIENLENKGQLFFSFFNILIGIFFIRGLVYFIEFLISKDYRLKGRHKEYFVFIIIFGVLGFYLSFINTYNYEKDRLDFFKKYRENGFFKGVVVEEKLAEEGKEYDISYGGSKVRVLLDNTIMEKIKNKAIRDNFEKGMLGKLLWVKLEKVDKSDKVNIKNSLMDKRKSLNLDNQKNRIIYRGKIKDWGILSDSSIYWKVYKKILETKDDFFAFLDKKEMFKETSLIKAMTFGYKDELSFKTKEELQKNGLAHLLAASGLHVAIVYGLLLKILPIFIKNRKTVYVVSLLFIWSYGIMCGMSSSIVRAGTTISLHIISKFINKPFDLLVATSAAGIASLLFNPLEVLSVSFQLSYIALFTIGNLLSIFKNNFHDDIKGQVGMFFLIPLVLQVMLIPITVYYFHYLSIGGFLASLLLTSFGGIILMLSILLFMAIIINNFLFFLNVMIETIINVEIFLIDIFLYMNNLIFQKGKYLVEGLYLDIKLVIFFYILSIFFISEKSRIILERLKA